MSWNRSILRGGSNTALDADICLPPSQLFLLASLDNSIIIISLAFLSNLKCGAKHLARVATHSTRLVEEIIRWYRYYIQLTRTDTKRSYPHISYGNSSCITHNNEYDIKIFRDLLLLPLRLSRTK